ncbi:putative lipid II flippase FtsW [Pseudemcibacter aquimaris]|uniref:putative lipid II flippase FtsW n=1 Tax=Pseudemcibacter aquimaris TaxID=2857064 RepID=UPI0020137988|nr:putative lipid II flippase FtsW [Pseudemcibacter aquimaris]MCC3861369.1 putative lipid II flippase FtsW [Pseudemcibacter aquimaris]WDU58141.1 putative lipid II flippase FtsW [Pseudemcibacter aquimaris]
MSTFSRTDDSVLSTWWWTVDRWLLMSIALLITIGIVLVFGASPAVAERIGLSSFHFVERQVVFLVLSIGVMFSVSLMNPLMVRRTGVLLFAACLVLLVATLIVGPEVKGARRWIPLGSFSLQASEFLKPAFIIFTAWMFSESSRVPGFPGWKISFASVVLVVGLLIAQPDFGQTMLVSFVWGVQLFMAGLAWFWVGALVVTALGGLLIAYLTLSHVADRIDRFFHPENADTYQVDLAINSFKNGGLLGTGPGEGTVKMRLPDAHSDYIFAVAGEEFGVVVCLLIIGIFAVIVIRGLVNLLKEQDMFTVLAVAGLLTQFGIQAFINLAVNLSIIPSKGMTLPFISYGGSSMIALAIGMGMILSLTRRYSQYKPGQINLSWGSK